MNQVAVFNPKANLPAYMQTGEISAAAKAMAGGGGSGKRLSVKGGVFRLMVDGKEVTAIDERYLDVVIVNAAPKVGRTFYVGTFDDSKPTAPLCWSPNGDIPDPTSKQKQSETCATCPQNVKGSGTGDSRACRYSQRVAVVLANDVEGHVMQLSLAATSLFGAAVGDNRPLQEYVRYMVAQGVDPTKLVTRLRFDTDSATPKLFFKAMRWLGEEENQICIEQGQSPDAIQAITMTVSQMDGVTQQAAPLNIPGKPPGQAAAPAAAPPVDAEPPAPPPKPRKPRATAAAAAAATPAAEPTVRASTPAAAASVPAAGGLAATLSQWDDE